MRWHYVFPRSRVEIAPEKQGSAFFFEKKKQKTLAYWGARWIQRAPEGSKFFGSFFQKRTASLYLA
jgi:hypothetical protein